MSIFFGPPQSRDVGEMPDTFDDVTSILQNASKSMKLGDVYFSPGFEFRHAMHAIEMMNPKMDSGMQECVVESVQHRLEHNTFRLIPEASELPCIMDKLLRMQVSLLDGNALAQTLLTCLWTRSDILQTLRTMCGLPLYQGASDVDPGAQSENLSDAVSLKAIPPHCRKTYPQLKLTNASPVQSHQVSMLEPGSHQHLIAFTLLAYVTASMKLAEFSRLMIWVADIYEDEDFHSFRHGLDMAFTVSSDEAIAMLRDAEALLLRSLRDSSPEQIQRAEAQLEWDSSVASAKKSRRRKKKGGVVPTGGIVDKSIIDAAQAMFVDDPVASKFDKFTSDDAAVICAFDDGFGLANVDSDPLPFAFTKGGPPPKSSLRQYAEHFSVGLDIWNEYESKLFAAKKELDNSEGQGQESFVSFDAAQPVSQPNNWPLFPPKSNQLSDDDATSVDLVVALVLRLRFLRSTLISYHHLVDPTQLRHSSALVALENSAQALQRIRATSKGAQYELEHEVHPQTDEYVKETIARLGSAALAPSTAGRSVNKYTDSFDADHTSGFDSSINRSLLLPSPPRCAPLPTYIFAFKYLEKHVRHLSKLSCCRWLWSLNLHRMSCTNPALPLMADRGLYEYHKEQFEVLAQYFKLSAHRTASKWRSSGAPTVTSASDRIHGQLSVDPNVFQESRSPLDGLGVTTEVDGRVHISLDVIFQFQDSLVHDDANCFVRSIMAMILLYWPSSLFGSHHIGEMVESSIRENGISNSHMRLESFQFFLQQMIPEPIKNIVRLGCLSLTRRRRRLDACLRDWAILQEQSQIVDLDVLNAITKAMMNVDPKDDSDLTKKLGYAETLQNAENIYRKRLSLWTSSIVSRLMLEHLLAGLRDQIFSDAELPFALIYMTYMYAFQRRSLSFLPEKRTQLYDYLRSTMEEKNITLEQLIDEELDSTKHVAVMGPVTSTELAPEVEYIVIESKEVISEILAHLLVVASKSQAYARCPALPLFGHASTQFDHRFRDFHQFQSIPRALTFEDAYAALRINSSSTNDLLREATKSIEGVDRNLKLAHDMNKSRRQFVLHARMNSHANGVSGTRERTRALNVMLAGLERTGQKIKDLQALSMRSSIFIRATSQMPEFVHADATYERICRAEEKAVEELEAEINAKAEASVPSDAEDRRQKVSKAFSELLGSMDVANRLRDFIRTKRAELNLDPTTHVVSVSYNNSSYLPVVSLSARA